MDVRRAISISRLALASALLLPLIAGCGLGSDSGSNEPIVWRPVTEESPPVVREATPPVTPSPAASLSALATQQLERLQPNELGAIPVLQYHVITTDESDESDPFVRTADHFREDLQWLYDHGFYVISTRSFVENRIAAPVGKRPVLLTFDDTTASQFRWVDDGAGRTIDADSAVGVLEAFFADHPDFGRGGQFAVLPHNCFADDTPLNTLDDCPEKLRWLAANGYEIVNHTAGHQDLLDVPDDVFVRELGEPIAWLDAIVEGEANFMEAVVMPYGNYPSRDLHPEQREMMRNGFDYEGRAISIRAAFMVGANPTESPSSAEYDPLFIARIQANAESLDQWFGMIEDGEILIYVSDGNPDGITIPDPVPASLEDQFDPELIEAAGHELIRYPGSG